MSTYDQRQFRRMSELISEFDGSPFRLRKTISDLEALVRSLEDADMAWKQMFWDQVGALEEVNAYMLDEERVEMIESERVIVDRALSALAALLDKMTLESSDSEPPSNLH